MGVENLKFRRLMKIWVAGTPTPDLLVPPHQITQILDSGPCGVLDTPTTFESTQGTSVAKIPTKYLQVSAF